VALRTKVKNALDEARILVLGTQVLLGFQYRAFFEPAFERLPPLNQGLELVGLLLLLVAMGLVLLPAARHRLVEMVTLPLGFAGDLWVVVRKQTGSIPAAHAAGVGSLLFFYGLWFCAMLVLRARREQRAA